MPTIQLVMNQRIDSPAVEIRNVFYLDGDTVGPTQIGEAAQALYDAWDTHIQPNLAENWRLYGYTWRNVSIAGSQGVEEFFATPLVGLTTANEPLPYTVAALVSFRTGTPPPNQGRKYLSGFTTNVVDEGLWLAAFITALQGWGNAVIAASEAASLWDFVVARIDPNSGLATAVNSYSTALARSVPATMRSRRPGVGI